MVWYTITDMTTTILRHVRPWGRAAADLTLTDGTITAITPTGSDAFADTTIDGRGLLALPGFVNAHAHADKSWWGQPWVSYGGEPTTQGRIAHERAERDSLGIPSLSSTTAVLREYLRHGTTAARSHVDVDLGVELRGIDTLRQAAADLGDAIELSIVAFPQDGVLRRPGVLELLDRAALAGASHIGGLDPASIDRDPVRQLDGLFEIAVHRGVGIDLHLHDRGSLGHFQFELIAERALAAGLQGRVTISHGFALGELSGTRAEDMLAALAEAGISWATVAPPTTAPLPWRRMRELGIEVGLGTDGIRDLWGPFGDGDILRVALGFARSHGLRTDEELAYAVELASSRGGVFVGRTERDLTVGSRADVVLVDAENVPDALCRAPRRELVLAGGQPVVENGELLV